MVKSDATWGIFLSRLYQKNFLEVSLLLECQVRSQQVNGKRFWLGGMRFWVGLVLDEGVFFFLDLYLLYLRMDSVAIFPQAQQKLLYLCHN